MIDEGKSIKHQIRSHHKTEWQQQGWCLHYYIVHYLNLCICFLKLANSLIIAYQDSIELTPKAKWQHAIVHSSPAFTHDTFPILIAGKEVLIRLEHQIYPHFAVSLSSNPCVQG